MKKGKVINKFINDYGKSFFSIINKISSFKIRESFPSMSRTIQRFDINEVYDEALRFICENQNNLIDLTNYISLLEDEDVKISYRIKSKISYINKWNNKSEQSIQLREVCNDLLGIRVIINREREEINNFIDKCLSSNHQYKIDKVDMYSKGKAKDDGYRAIHLYFKNNSKCFPIEIQFWNQEDAILNFYTHDYIYKRTKQDDFSYYGNELRKWLDSIPNCPSGVEINYIEYLYKRIYSELGGNE